MRAEATGQFFARTCPSAVQSRYTAAAASCVERSGREWVAVLTYLSLNTHRVAISNSRLISFDETGVTFRYKDYHHDGVDRRQIITLATAEFIRRFLIHILPKGFHRIRHYGLLAGGSRKTCVARARELVNVVQPPAHDAADEPTEIRPPCP